VTARILDVTPAAYHRLPGFSASLAKVLITKSAAHARDVYERKLEAIEAEDETEDGLSDDQQKRRDNGTIQHALLLGKGAERIKVIPAALLAANGAYSTKASKAARDEARAAGQIPVKEHEVEIHERVADAIRTRIIAAGHVLDGTSELGIAWTESTPSGDVDCRAMLDHVVMWGIAGERPFDGETAPGAIIYDLKIVGDAHPDRCERTAENLGYAIQAAAYTRALTALYPKLGGRIDFRFLFVESRRPFALWDPSLSGPFREIGERRWVRAVHAWAKGVATGRWPDYRTPDRVEITAPMWTLRAEGYQPEDF
jgi:hypothetical protein